MDRLDEIISRLECEYGTRQWHVGEDAMSVLVKTILSQNTADVNSHRAFVSLRETFPDWETVAAADIDELAESIKSGGLAVIKAKRIKFTLQHIQDRNGGFDLDFLAELPLSESKAWLRQLPGVGPKTAGCVLLFGLGRSAFPVDTHIFRLAKRLGIIDSKVSVDVAHDMLESIFPSSHFYQLHIQMIEHGRQVCHAQRPRCDRCVLADVCPSASMASGRSG
jgi:endonuclease-3